MGGAIALLLIFHLPLLVGGVITGAVSLLLLAIQNRRGQRAFERGSTGLLLIIAIGFLTSLGVEPPALADVAGGLRLTVTDEDGITTTTDAALALQPAQQAEQALAGLRASVGKLGNTMFEAGAIDVALSQPWFVPASAINGLRRDAIAAQEAARLAAWQRPQRAQAVEPPAPYPETH